MSRKAILIAEMVIVVLFIWGMMSSIYICFTNKDRKVNISITVNSRVWTVEPTAGEKWVSCLTTRTTKSCSSPTSYDKAKWWSDTEGGRKFKQ